MEGLTAESITAHFVEHSAWREKLLLISVRDITAFEKRTKRLWEVLDFCTPGAACLAIKSWTWKNAKIEGIVFDAANKLRFYKATSSLNSNEAYGTN
jgi:hypothetical protein